MLAENGTYYLIGYVESALGGTTVAREVAFSVLSRP
jgi:hypothetical protein